MRQHHEAKEVTAYSLQSLTDFDKNLWQSASQGSRLIPLSWFMALERTEASGLISDRRSMARFGFLYEQAADTLPIGVAVDQQRDDQFEVTGLRWFSGQGGATDGNAAKWVGLTCSACHTSEINYRGDRMLIAGGPAPFDFQKFVLSLDRAILQTLNHRRKFARFAKRVLKSDNTAANRKLLKTALAKFARWQTEVAQLDQTNLQYGPGRVDAFGRLGNKVAKFASLEPFVGHEPNAPVSYPHLWNSHLQKRVQWNGSAKNFIVRDGARLVADLGALTRNSGEVIGVFADVNFHWKEKDQRYSRATRSSLNVPNMKALEKVATRFTAPQWPTVFPPLSQAKRRKGQVLYEQYCAECHLPEGSRTKEGGTERVLTFKQTGARNRTDIAAACNFYTAQVPTGKMENLRSIVLVGERLGPIAPAAQMVDTVVISSLLGKVNDISLELPPQLTKLALSGDLATVGNSSIRSMEEPFKLKARQSKIARCLESEHEDLGYKARPLEGIWATSPYLHNGSVPTLYDLLLPASRRPASFALGSREYDPVKVGFRQGRSKSVPLFRYKTRDRHRRPISGNGNQGHEYGTSQLTDRQRWELLEYLKGL
ncbi:MAG: di-heme-cytochrome C peroxidase [Rhizobiaceae bacterium]